MTDTTKRNCDCPKSRHYHGTMAAYFQDRCRCLQCRIALSDGRRAWRAGEGMRETQWGSAVGVNRRLQALACIGHSSDDIASVTGLTRHHVAKLRSQTQHPKVHAELHTVIHDVYNTLWNKPRTDVTGRRVATIARKAGYHPPMAWDDDSIDDPNAGPDRLDQWPAANFFDEIAVERAIDGDQVHLTKPERAYAVTLMTERGFSAKQIGERLGLTSRQIVRDRTALGIAERRAA